MGGSASKTAVQSLSESISNVAMSTVQNCEVASSQDQSLTVVNSGIRLWGTYRLEQKTDIKSTCFSDVNKQVDLQNKIIDTISQASTAENVALLGAFGKSNAEATTNLRNIVQTNIKMSNIQTSYNAIKQKQTASFTNSGVIGFEQVELTQGSKIFAAATLQELDKAGIFNSISTYIDQTASAKMENPLDFIAKAIGAVGSTIMSSVFLIILLVAIGIFGFVMVLRAIGNADIPIGPPPVMAAAALRK